VYNRLQVPPPGLVKTGRRLKSERSPTVEAVS
jgi:hypothetical protein